MKNVYIGAKKQARTLKKRLITSNIFLLLLAYCFLLFIGYWTAREIYIKNVVKSSALQLGTAHLQIQAAHERAGMLTDSISQNEILLDASKNLVDSQGRIIAGLSAEIIAELGTYRSAVSFPMKLYLKIGNIIFDEVQVCAQDAACAPQSKNQKLYIEREQALLEEYAGQREKSASGKCYYAGSLDDGGVFLCVVDIRKMVDKMPFSALRVEMNGKSIYTQGEFDITDRSRLEGAGENNLELVSGISSDGRRLIIVYKPVNESLCYTACVDMRQIRSSVARYTIRLGLFALLTLLLAVPLFYATASFTMEPVKKLLAALDESQDSEQKLSQFIFDIRHQMSLRRRIYRHHLFVLLPLLVLCVFSLTMYQGIFYAQEKEIFFQAVQQTVNSVRLGVEQHIDGAKKLAFDRQFQQYVQKLAAGDSAQEAQGERFVTQYIYKNKYLFAHTLSVDIYDEDGQSIYLSNRPLSPRDAMPAQVKTYLDTGAFHTFDKRNDTPSTADFWFRIFYEKAPIAYVRFTVDNFLDTTVFGDNDLMAQSRYYLYDAQLWHILYPKVRTDFDSTVEGILQGKLLKVGEESYIRPTQGEGTQLAILEEIPNTSFYLLCFLPKTVLGESISQLLLYTILILFATIFLVCLMSVSFSARLIKPIAQLQRIFDQALGTSDKLYLPNFMDNELSMLADSFAAVLHRTNALQQLISKQESQVAQIERRRAQLEFMVLKEQLNPHFISNLFVSMRFMLRSRKLSELEETIKATGTFLRETAMLNPEGISLKKEVEVMGDYVQIHNIRFNNRISFEVCLPAEAEEQIVPQFLLQPLVENAITHGMPSEGALHIVLRAAVGEETVSLELWNDGKAMGAEKVEEIRKNLSEGISGNHIGLVNTMERIRLFYGDVYEFTVQSPSERETLIRIVLPEYKAASDDERKKTE